MFGPTGVGRPLAKVLSERIFGTKISDQVDMSEYRKARFPNDRILSLCWS